MTSEDWHLPELYCSDTHINGHVTLSRHGIALKEFLATVPKPAIEAWASAYECGHRQGHMTGLEQGRSELATELRQLLQVQGAQHAGP
jgi:hypothetical protein